MLEEKRRLKIKQFMEAKRTERLIKIGFIQPFFSSIIKDDSSDSYDKDGFVEKK